MHHAENVTIPFKAFLSPKPLLCVKKVIPYLTSPYFSDLIFNIITSNTRLSRYQLLMVPGPTSNVLFPASVPRKDSLCCCLALSLPSSFSLPNLITIFQYSS